MKLMRVLAWTVAGLWLAQSQLAGYENEEDPGPGVARVSLIRGDVSIRRGDSGDWVAAAINAPLVAADSVLTGGGSRAEIQLDHATFLRLASNTEVRLAQLERDRFVVELVQGTATLTLLRPTDAMIDLVGPNVSLKPATTGAYRMEARADQLTEITVREGRAEVYTPRGSEWLRSGQTMIVRGPVGEPEFQWARTPPRDEWDRWNEERDRQLRRAQSYRYVGRGIYGVEELDLYGRWIYVPPYGWVWSPHVTIAWAPYRYGRWCWLDWFGWTWVSYEPWGWAPYHWGRWFYHPPYGWLWWPGVVHVHHYHPWRPALVAFIGWSSWSGFHVGFGVGFGRIGWIPLAPWEPYHPWYRWRRGPDGRRVVYIDQSVHIVNNINVVNTYRNARVREAITVVDANDFASGRVRPLRLSSEVDFQRARLIRGTLPVVPRRETLRYVDHPAEPATLPLRTGGGDTGRRGRVVPQIERVPFDRQVALLEQVTRTPWREPGAEPPELPRQAVRLAEMPERTRAAAPETGSGSAESRPLRNFRSGWRRVEEPQRATQGNPDSTVPQSQQPMSVRMERGGQVRQGTGWRRFGEPMTSTTSREPVLERDRQNSNADASPPTEAPTSQWLRFGRTPARSYRLEPRGDEGWPTRPDASPPGRWSAQEPRSLSGREAPGDRAWPEIRRPAQRLEIRPPILRQREVGDVAEPRTPLPAQTPQPRSYRLGPSSRSPEFSEPAAPREARPSEHWRGYERMRTLSPNWERTGPARSSAPDHERGPRIHPGGGGARR